jgi:hypothetical protein
MQRATTVFPESEIVMSEPPTNKQRSSSHRHWRTITSSRVVIEILILLLSGSLSLLPLEVNTAANSSQVVRMIIYVNSGGS